MISRIELGENTILLRSPEKPNIFDIDSISLLIGNNGSGKTETLSNIISTFNCNRNANFYIDATVFNQKGLKFTSDELSNFSLIYFTPIPFTKKIYSHKNRFINASPKLPHESNAYELSEYKDIIEEFDIEPKLTATIETNYKKIIKTIANIILSYQNRNKHIISSLPPLQKIIELKLKLIDDEQETTPENTKLTYERNKKTNEMINNQYDNLYNLIIEKSENKVEPYILFSIFSIIEWAMKNGRASQSTICKIIEIHFNIKVNTKNYLYNKNMVHSLNDKIKSLFNIFKTKNDYIKQFVFSTTNENIGIYKVNFILKPYTKKTDLSNLELDTILDIKLFDMSSGQLALLEQIGAISNAIKELSNKNIKKILLLIDEGDAFLHLEWQGKYIYTLNKMLSRIKKSLNIEVLQVILATHSPILATDIPKEFICRLGVSNQHKISGFAAPLYKLIDNSFNTKTIGQFSSEKINSLITKIKDGKLNEIDYYLIEQIDNDLVRNEIKRLVNQHQKNNKSEL